MVDFIIDIGIAKGPDLIEDEVGIKLCNAIFLDLVKKVLVDALDTTIADNPRHSADRAECVHCTIPFVPKTK